MILCNITDYLDTETFYNVKNYLMADRLARDGLYHSNVVCKEMFGFTDRVTSVKDSIERFQKQYNINNINDFLYTCIQNMSMQEIRACVLAICDVDIRLCDNILTILEDNRLMDVCCGIVYASYMSSVHGDNKYMRFILLDTYNSAELMVILRYLGNKATLSQALDIYFDNIRDIFSKLDEKFIIDNIHSIYWLAVACSKYNDASNKVGKFYKNIYKLITTNCNSVIEGVLIKYGMGSDVIVALNYLFQTVDSDISNAFTVGKKDKVIQYTFSKLLQSNRFHFIIEEIIDNYDCFDVDVGLISNINDDVWVYSLLKDNGNFDSILARLRYDRIKDVLDSDVLYRIAKNSELTYKIGKDLALQILENVIVSKYNCDYLFGLIDDSDILENKPNDIFLDNLSTYIGDVDDKRKDSLLCKMYEMHGRNVLDMLPNIFKILGNKVHPYYKCRIPDLGFSFEDKSDEVIELMFDFILEKRTKRFLDFLYYVLSKTDKCFEYKDVLMIVDCIINSGEFTVSEIEYIVHMRIQDGDMDTYLAQIQRNQKTLEERVESGDPNVVDEFKQLLLDGNIDTDRAFSITDMLLEQGLIDEYDLDDITDLMGDDYDD